MGFSVIWKDADPGINEVEDARKRLAGLTNPHIKSEEDRRIITLRSY